MYLYFSKEARCLIAFAIGKLQLLVFQPLAEWKLQVYYLMIKLKTFHNRNHMFVDRLRYRKEIISFSLLTGDLHDLL